MQDTAHPWPDDPRRTFEMRSGETVLGRLYVNDVNMPWFACDWRPTTAFTELKPQFENARRTLEASDQIEEQRKGVFEMERIIEEHALAIHEIGETPTFQEPITIFLAWLSEDGTMSWRPPM